MAVVGRVLLIPKGDYDASATYNALDWVRYNGASWVCKLDNTTNITPTISATTNWQLLAEDGTVGGWSSIANKPFETVGAGLDVTNDADKALYIPMDASPTSGSNKPVTSGGVYTALSNKQDTLTFDNVPTQNSDNPVKSGGVYSSLDEFTAAETQSGTTVTFSGLNPSYGYQLFWDDASDSGDLAVPKPININKTIDSGTGLMTLVYTIKGGSSGSSQFKLRILK